MFFLAATLARWIGADFFTERWQPRTYVIVKMAAAAIMDFQKFEILTVVLL